MQRKSKQEAQFKIASSFQKDLDQAPVEIQIAFRELYAIFRDEPTNQILRNHVLKKVGKRYFGLWSIDVTDDWRAVYRKEKDFIIFVELNTHDKLYQK